MPPGFEGDLNEKGLKRLLGEGHHLFVF